MAYRSDSGGGPGAVAGISATSLAWQFVLQVIAGAYLSRAYIPDPKYAHGTMESILGASPHSIVAGFHYWGGLLFLAHSLVHLAIMMFGGLFRAPNQWRWFTAILFVGCAMLFQITGNLLPFDQHGVQSAAIEGGIAASIPGGRPLAAVLMGGQTAFNTNTLPTWYFAHRVLIPIALTIGILASAGSLMRQPSGRARWPIAILIALIPVVAALAIPSPLGTGATFDDFNRFGARVGWYSWPLHGSLNAFSHLDPSLGWIGSAVIPALFAIFLLVAPALSQKLATWGVQVIFVVFVAYFVVAGILFGGAPAPLTGSRDPVVTVESPRDGDGEIDQALAERGRQAFNAGPCVGCHGPDGEESSGGPNLAGVGKRHAEAQWFIDFIHNPKSKKPGTMMPSFSNLDQGTIRALAEYLRSKR